MSCNNIRISIFPVILNGGWHLSYFGDANFIKNKIENFSHQELNTNNFTDLVKINEKINNCVDLYDRNIEIKKINIEDNNYLPIEYNIYLTKFYTL
jgi:beta-1,4-mannosyl-glycoprotein beta-1,4-N-acetylglucosaminyltransferase